jgi:hypothetical protein
MTEPRPFDEADDFRPKTDMEERHIWYSTLQAQTWHLGKYLALKSSNCRLPSVAH